MIRLFKWLTYGDGHLHKWTNIKEGTILNSDKGIIGVTYVLQCEVCGDIKIVKDYI